MIKDRDQFINHLANWLGTYAKSNGKSAFVLPFKGRSVDAVLLQICSEAIKTLYDISIIACYEQESKSILDLVFSGKKIETSTILDIIKISDSNNGIIIGSVTRSESLYRPYKKHETNICDLFPFLDVKYSDIDNIANYFWPNINWINQIEDIQSMERVLDLNDRVGIITSNTTPEKHDDWKYLMHYNKVEVSLTHQREKITKHKDIMYKPHPSIRNLEHIFVINNYVKK